MTKFPGWPNPTNN